MTPSSSFLARVRWANVARAAALLGVVALVVLWPRLRAEAPRLPAAQARPVEAVAREAVPRAAEFGVERAARPPVARAPAASRRRG
ncbi:MAG TPA: hypothetical protein VD931_19990, partial [Baekduia sp.]|nr:hypothetical protein [Baekduia sp.]